MKTAAILVAAGSSARMKSGGASKTMMEIGGEPVLSRTLRAFENAACISKIVIVARACDFDAIQKASAFVTKPLTITEGGKERQDSVSNGAALCGDAEYIAVHDAARPFITPEEIETVCADAEKYGAATLGDIGVLFPDDDPQYAGADSLKLLAVAVAAVRRKGFGIENIDATILAQRPKLRPYIDEMRRNIASACNLDLNCVSIKATTEEGLGFTGRGEGIAAHAVCLLK